MLDPLGGEGALRFADLYGGRGGAERLPALALRRARATLADGAPPPARPPARPSACRARAGHRAPAVTSRRMFVRRSAGAGSPPQTSARSGRRRMRASWRCRLRSLTQRAPTAQSGSPRRCGFPPSCPPSLPPSSTSARAGRCGGRRARCSGRTASACRSSLETASTRRAPRSPAPASRRACRPCGVRCCPGPTRAGRYAGGSAALECASCAQWRALPPKM